MIRSDLLKKICQLAGGASRRGGKKTSWDTTGGVQEERWKRGENKEQRARFPFQEQ